ncbi:prepilin peptidase [Erwinia tasmaniensis]|nr:prepilin peptidase [Erwinia tasmaniensis]
MLFVSILYSLVLAFNIPTLYQGAKVSVVENNIYFSKQDNSVSIKPFFATFIICAGVVPCWLVSHSYGLTFFIALFGSAAYIDYVTRWVPDILIFALSWIALSTVMPGEFDAAPVLVSAAVMVIPCLVVNVIAIMRCQRPALASGDIYLLPAIGVWLRPEWGAACLVTSFLLAGLGGLRYQNIPFVTVIYPVFVVAVICNAQ